MPYSVLIGKDSEDCERDRPRVSRKVTINDLRSGTVQEKPNVFSDKELGMPVALRMVQQVMSTVSY